jgi:hypothetical protein
LNPRYLINPTRYSLLPATLKDCVNKTVEDLTNKTISNLASDSKPSS